MKKAQGLPITTVILATLGLLVLLVLFAIVTGRLAWFTIGVETCPGSCVGLGECEKAGGIILPGKFFRSEDKTVPCPSCCSAPKSK